MNDNQLDERDWIMIGAVVVIFGLALLGRVVMGL